MEEAVMDKTSPLAVARTWVDFLVSQRLLCKHPCCVSTYNRTVMQTTIYLTGKDEDERVEALNLIENLSTGASEGFVSFFTWDGFTARRARSKTGKKSALRIRGEEVIARRRTASRR